MILFFDTETTGLPDERLPAGHPSQPHLVQLACLLTEEDGTERGCFSVIVNPQVPIPDRVSQVHGITDDLALRAGVREQTALGMWARLAELAKVMVAHNIRFDMALMETAWSRGRKDMTFADVHGRRPQFCTMEGARPILNLPPTERMAAAGIMGPKPPRLAECVKHFFGEELPGAHDALVDARACARVYFHLRGLGAQEGIKP